MFHEEDIPDICHLFLHQNILRPENITTKFSRHKTAYSVKFHTTLTQCKFTHHV